MDRMASYFGPIPSVRNSAGTMHHGRITKAGTPLVRHLLTEAVIARVTVATKKGPPAPVSPRLPGIPAHMARMSHPRTVGQGPSRAPPTLRMGAPSSRMTCAGSRARAFGSVSVPWIFPGYSAPVLGRNPLPVGMMMSFMCGVRRAPIWTFRPDIVGCFVGDY